MKPFLAAVLLVSISVSSSAQTQSVSAQIVVTASSVPESLESTPASVTVITRDDIEQQQARDVAGLLREVPGMAIARTGSPGKSTTLFMRGGSSKQALVLWNGVEMNNSYLSGYDFGQLSTTGVEKIEVIRGPYSALYGSDAVSGVVNVLTAPSRGGLEVGVEGGGHGLRNGAVSGSVVNKGWTAYGSAEHRDDDGFAVNDDFSSDTFVAGISNSFISLLGRHNRYDTGIPRNANAGATAFVASPHRRQSGSETEFSLPIRFTLAGIHYDIRFADNERNEKFGDPDAPFGPEFGNTDSSTRSVRATAQFAKTTTIGAEVERNDVDHVDSFGLDVRHRSRDSRSLFAEQNRSFGPVQLSAGVRYDHFDAFGSQISPRIGAAWSIGGSKLRAAYGEGFRAPAIGELYAPFFGNPDLDAERSRNVEVGFDHYAKAATLSVTAFRSDYDNLITYDIASSRFGNIARSRSRGVEVSALRKLGALRGSISYTYLEAIDLATGQQLVRRPRNSGTAMVGWEGRPVAADVILIYAGRRSDVRELVPFGNVVNQPYTTADVVLRYAAQSFSPFVKVENATDRKYQEVFGYPSASRRFIAGIRYSMR